MTIVDLWEAFWRWTDGHPANAYLFRGQADSSPICPKIGRPEYGYARAKEKQLFDAFKRAARPFVRVAPENDFEWLALAQHHGAPTRLADWSTSPLVAGWFAVSSFPLNTDAKIYALDLARTDIEAFDPETMKSVKTNRGFASPLDMTADVYLIETAPVSSRITTQRGIFTVHGDPTAALNIDPVDEFTIPKDMREQFQGRLLDVGIDASHIFPDLDGLCKTLDWRLRTGKSFSAFL